MVSKKAASDSSDKSADSAATSGPSDDEVIQLLDRLDQHSDSADSPGNLIGMLQDIQERFGYLPAFALEEVARRTGISLSRVYGVVSFYTQFYLTPRGRHTIRCCRGTACHVKGSSRIINAVTQTLGIAEGQTTPDMEFYLETVACLGTCFLAPAMMIDNLYFGDLTPQKVQSILKNYNAD